MVPSASRSTDCNPGWPVANSLCLNDQTKGKEWMRKSVFYFLFQRLFQNVMENTGVQVVSAVLRQHCQKVYECFENTDYCRGMIHVGLDT